MIGLFKIDKNKEKSLKDSNIESSIKYGESIENYDQFKSQSLISDYVENSKIHNEYGNSNKIPESKNKNNFFATEKMFEDSIQRNEDDIFENLNDIKHQKNNKSLNFSDFTDKSDTPLFNDRKSKEKIDDNKKNFLKDNFFGISNQNFGVRNDGKLLIENGNNNKFLENNSGKNFQKKNDLNFEKRNPQKILNSYSGKNNGYLMNNNLDNFKNQNYKEVTKSDLEKKIILTNNKKNNKIVIPNLNSEKSFKNSDQDFQKDKYHNFVGDEKKINKPNFKLNLQNLENSNNFLKNNNNNFKKNEIRQNFNENFVNIKNDKTPLVYENRTNFVNFSKINHNNISQPLEKKINNKNVSRNNNNLQNGHNFQNINNEKIQKCTNIIKNPNNFQNNSNNFENNSNNFQNSNNAQKNTKNFQNPEENLIQSDLTTFEKIVKKEKELNTRIEELKNIKQDFLQFTMIKDITKDEKNQFNKTLQEIDLEIEAISNKVKSFRKIPLFEKKEENFKIETKGNFVKSFDLKKSDFERERNKNEIGKSEKKIYTDKNQLPDFFLGGENLKKNDVLFLNLENKIGEYSLQASEEKREDFKNNVVFENNYFEKNGKIYKNDNFNKKFQKIEQNNYNNKGYSEFENKEITFENNNLGNYQERDRFTFSNQKIEERTKYSPKKINFEKNNKKVYDINDLRAISKNKSKSKKMIKKRREELKKTKSKSKTKSVKSKNLKSKSKKKKIINEYFTENKKSLSRKINKDFKNRKECLKPLFNPKKKSNSKSKKKFQNSFEKKFSFAKKSSKKQKRLDTPEYKYKQINFADVKKKRQKSK